MPRGVKTAPAIEHEIRRMRMRQLSEVAIAKKLGIPQSTVSSVLMRAKLAPQPNAGQIEILPQFDHLFEHTADAFEEFFNEYSPYTLAPHSKMLVEEAMGHEKVLLNVPPRHAKSEVFSVWVPIWLICMNKDIRILIGSKTSRLANKWLKTMAKHMEENEKLIIDFGPFKPAGGEVMWSPAQGQITVTGRSRLELSGEATVMTLGSLQQIIGFGADVTIVDDAVDFKNSRTENQRDDVEEWFDMEVDSRYDPQVLVPFQRIVIGTRVHEDDLYGRLSRRVIGSGDERPIWQHISHPAISDGYGNPVLDFTNGQALWPDRIPLTRKEARVIEGREQRRVNSLEQIYEGMGSGTFSQTYQQQPAPPDELLVRPEWVEACKDHSRAWGERANRDGWVRVVSVDPSGTMFWAFTVADVKPNSIEFHCDIIEAFRSKMDMRKVHAELTRIAEVYRPKYWIQEINSMSRHFATDEWAEDFKRQHSLRLIGHTTGMNKADQLLGVDSMAVDFEFGRIRIPAGGDYTRKQIANFLDELLHYPYGRTTDQVMSLWFIKNNHGKLFSPTKSGPIPMHSWTIPGRNTA